MTWKLGEARPGPARELLPLLGVSVVISMLALSAADVQAAKRYSNAVPAACNRPYNPNFKASDFKNAQGKPFEIENPYFPLDPGTTYVFEGIVDDELERGVMEVTHTTKLIKGIRAVEVHDQEFADLDGDGDLDLAEDTLDWYAQDKWGNVWYLGEDTKEFDAEGNVISTEGTWLTGVDGAKPGIVMEAQPKVGDVYRQEFLKGEAEDMARVVNLNRHVTVPYGSFDHVLQTEEWACHDPKAPHEDKYYAREVGNIKVRARDGSETIKLVKVLEEDD